jgi:hypothetical protein
MALEGEAKKVYQREYMKRRRQQEWDEKKFPNRDAWEIAVVRAEHAQVYAEKFPEHVRPSEECFQSVEWQYEHEGLPSVRKLKAGLTL